MTIAIRRYQRPGRPRRFEALLTAWKLGEDVTWADLMTAWVKAPPAPMTRETILKIVQCLKKK